MKYLFYVLFGVGAFSLDCQAEGSEFSFDSFSSLPDSVFSPARMEQTIANTPGAVTVITGQQIKNLGIKTIGEVIKLVPGFNVKGDYINRGNINPAPRRLQVLLNGVSQVNSLVGVVIYSAIPAPVENIARIEVTRSQAAASYGANSFLGVINIITRHPIDRQGAELHWYESDRGDSGYLGYAGRFANTSFSIDFKNYEYDTYDTLIDSDVPKNDDLWSEVVSAQLVSYFNNKNSFEFYVTGARGEMELDFIGTVWGTDYPIVEHQVNQTRMKYSFNSRNHSSSIAASLAYRDQNYQWETCGPRAFFYPGLGEAVGEYLLSGVDLQSFQFGSLSALFDLFQTGFQLAITPSSYDIVCGISDADYRYKTYEIEFNDVWNVNRSLRISSGLFLNSRSMESKYYGNGLTELDKSQLFTNAEFLLGDIVTFNVGTFVESLGHEFSNPQFSPRVGLNIHLTPSSTAKLIVSRGKRVIDGIELIEDVRMPTYFETEVYGSKTQYSFVGYHYINNTTDHVEKIDSIEFIYITSGRFYSTEVRLFQEDLSDILNNQANIFRPVWPLAEVNREGVEVSFVKQKDDYQFGVSAHYIDSNSEESIFQQYSYYGGHAYFTKSFRTDFKFSMAYYGTSKYYYGTETAITPREDRLYNEDGRLDIRLVKSWYIGASNLDIEVMFSHHINSYDTPQVLFAPENSGERDNENEISLGISGRF